MVGILEEQITRREAEILAEQKVAGVIAEFRSENDWMSRTDEGKAKIAAIPDEIGESLDKLFNGRETISVSEGLGVLNAKIAETNKESVFVDLEPVSVSDSELAAIRDRLAQEKILADETAALADKQTAINQRVDAINTERKAAGLETIQNVVLQEGDDPAAKLQEVDAKAPTNEEIAKAKSESEQEPNILQQIMGFVMALVAMFGAVFGFNKKEDAPEASKPLVSALDSNLDGKITGVDFDRDKDGKLTSVDQNTIKSELANKPELLAEAEKMAAGLNIKYQGETVENSPPSSGTASSRGAENPVLGK